MRRSSELATGNVMRGIVTGAQQLLQIGDCAPDFDLPKLQGGVKGRFHLADELKEKSIVLAFYPSNWKDVSTRQMAEYQAQRNRFQEQNADLVGISVDSIMNTTSWERVIGPLDFALCSDFWPHGAVSSAYGVFRLEGPHAGCCERAVVVISRSGSIAFRKVYEDSEHPPLAETWEALRAA
jgi:mycoredoxin-dependent peroxiredoxin